MPVKLERALIRKAVAKGLKGERKDAYVYGTLRKTGWKPSREKRMSAINTRLDEEIRFMLGPAPGALGAAGQRAVGYRFLRSKINRALRPQPGINPGVSAPRGNVSSSLPTGPGGSRSVLSDFLAKNLRGPAVNPGIAAPKAGVHSALPTMTPRPAVEPVAPTSPVPAATTQQTVQTFPDKMPFTDKLKYGLYGAGIGTGVTAGVGTYHAITRDKRMSAKDKIIRLSEINSKLDEVIRFERDDDDEIRRRGGFLKTAAGIGTVGTLGAGGLYAAGHMGSRVAPFGAGIIRGKTLGQTGSSLLADVKNIGGGGGGAIGRSIMQGATNIKHRAFGLLRKIRFEEKTKLDRMIELRSKMDDVIRFRGGEDDPTAEMFGGEGQPDPIAQSYEDAEQVSALQKLRLKIARLRAMGLHE